MAAAAAAAPPWCCSPTGPVARRPTFLAGAPLPPRRPAGQWLHVGPRPAGAPRAEGGWDLWKLLGGRGLQGGEQGLKTEDGLKRLYRDDVTPTVAKVKQALSDLSEDAVGAFDKELAGLTGGFPGGEQGLREFLTKYPPPQKMSKEMQALREQLAAPVSRPALILPPLLMPGMTVRVNNPNDIYHQYTGIVQRVTDGKVGVLFEGGNWDKLVAFDLEEVQRTKKGPPGNNPKSAILLEDEDS